MVAAGPQPRTLDVTGLNDADRVFGLSPEGIILINPNTGTLPIFPIGEVQKRVVGDWKSLADMARVVGNVGSGLYDLAYNVQSGAGTLGNN